MMQSLQQFAPYEAYQDSGVEWLGEIPQGWQPIRLKNCVLLNAQALPENTPKTYEFEYVDIGSVSFERGIEATEKYTFKASPSRARRIAKAGDTIISTVRTYLKAIDYITPPKANYIYSTGFAVLTPRQNLSPFYLPYLIKSNFFTDQVAWTAKGMSYPAINSSELSGLLALLPPLAEQTAIANFLDQKTAEIDQATALKTDLIERLKEYKQITIQHAVTRGLDPNAKMKASGVEWIGDIPESWEVLKLKYVLEERNERSLTGNEPLFMVSQIHGLVVRSEYHDKAEVAQSTIGNKIVYENDLVFNKLKAHLGVFFRSKIEFAGIVSPDYAVYKSKGIFYDLVFLEYLFRHPAYIGQFVIRATGIVEGLIRLYTSELFQIHVPVPPLHEQTAIVAHIEAISAKIDQATDQAQQQINTLTEYKTVLINAAVTGKIKVTDDSAQGTRHAQ